MMESTDGARVVFALSAAELDALHKAELELLTKWDDRKATEATKLIQSRMHVAPPDHRCPNDA